MTDVPDFDPPQPVHSKPRPPHGGLPPDSPEADLFEALRPLRRQLAHRQGVPPFWVLTDAALAEVATVRPANEQVLRSIAGIHRPVSGSIRLAGAEISPALEEGASRVSSYGEDQCLL